MSIVQGSMYVISFKSKYGYELMSYAYLILFFRNTLRFYDFEETEKSFSTTAWNGLMMQQMTFGIIGMTVFALCY